ncbi:hypothetical protein [Pectobacterium polaris]|nr:hypothetical protein [Pectobacterium polaris]
MDEKLGVGKTLAWMKWGTGDNGATTACTASSPSQRVSSTACAISQH